MSENNIFLSICTPTYNRAYCLSNLYESLCKQTSKQFEWIIIDDGSSDETEKLINQWIEEKKDFTIIYDKQIHGGKHRALNKGVNLATAPFFFIVDSDDRLLGNAVELVCAWTQLILDKIDYAGVSGLRINKNGQIIGGMPTFSGIYVDITNFERRKHGLCGDKAEVYRTELLKKNVFPEFENELFITEDICWMNIAYLGYKIRWYNVPIYECEYLDDGLSISGANDIEGHKKNYKGYCYYISECVKKKPFIEKMISFKEYINSCRKMEISLKKKM